MIILSILCPCGVSELAAISEALVKRHGEKSLIMRQTGNMLEFVKVSDSSCDTNSSSTTPEIMPDLIMAGIIYCGIDAEEAAGDPIEYGLVIRCQNKEQVQAALNSGTVAFTKFQHQEYPE